jgi:hypothetical protein
LGSDPFKLFLDKSKYSRQEEKPLKLSGISPKILLPVKYKEM